MLGMKEFFRILVCFYCSYYGSFCHACDLGNEKNRPSFEELTSDQEREEYLKNFDLSNVSLGTQQNILKWIDGPGRKNITLKKCSLLDDNFFKGRLFLGTLVQINLQGSPEITENFLLVLAQVSPNLESLDLSHTPKIKRIADSDYIFWYKPIKFENLRELNVNNCPALESIDLEAHQLERLSANQSPRLKFLTVKSPNAEYLSCQGTAITDNILYEVLHHAPNLKTLDLTNCPNLTKQGGDFCEAFFNIATLKSLNLRSAGINDSKSLSIGPILERNTTITELDLSDNEIGANILGALARNKTITKLKLACNRSSIGINGILNFILNTTTVNDLNLAGCILSKAELLVVAHSKTIAVLNLSYVRNVDSDEVLEAFAQNTALEKINVIGCVSGIFLLTPSLTEFRLGENLAVLRTSKTLTTIWAFLPGHGHPRGSYTPDRRYEWYKEKGEWRLKCY